MRIGTALAVALTLVPAFAQIDLATTYDGSALYFRVVTQNGINRIERWTRESGVTVFADRPDQGNLSGIQTTYAGSVTYHKEPRCSVGLGPGFNDCPAGESVVAIPNVERFSLYGFLLISPSGRYGVSSPYKSGALWEDWITGEAMQVDYGVPALGMPGVNPGFSINQHVVANDGSFLIKDPRGLRIWSRNGESFLPLRDYIISATISGDGSTVAVAPYDPCCMTSPTYVYDLPSGRVTIFALEVSMSDDGKTVAYLSADPRLPVFPNPQAVVARSDGTGARQIGDVPEGLHAVLLSGDGKILYAVTATFSGPSRILRYEVKTGAVEEIPIVP